MRADAVVVMGSGFSSPETPEIDKWGKRRLARAIELVKNSGVKFMIITGGGVHPKFGVRFVESLKALAIEEGVGSSKILIASNLDSYPKTTIGDIDQAFDVAVGHHFVRLEFITEKPHWLFRVRIFTNVDRTGFTVSGWHSALPAPLWYWIKEFVYWLALICSLGREDSWLCQTAGRSWKKIGHHFGLYVVN